VAKEKVVVAMSGGVDSSVAAALLVEQGYDVVGLFMRVGAHGTADDDNAVESRRQGCCSAADSADARRVAGRLDVPFYALNFERDFDRLIDHFADEYTRGRTPNPCVVCNQDLKFGKVLRYADTVDAQYIATGHYARITAHDNGPRLMRPRDPRKDQSYVLFGVDRAVLRRTLFPLGDLTKDQVRDIARDRGLANCDKPDSAEICFVPDRDYARVVRERRPDAARPGTVRDRDGNVVGTHDGIANFTVGQRRGLGIAMGLPIYVTGLDAETATVTVGDKQDLLAGALRASNVNWLVDPPAGPFRALAQIRYHHQAAPADVHHDGDGIEVRFDEPQSAITPGQAVVLYDNETVLGGGWIESSPR
jgi:tRNA-specific 2-thiouridylase